MPFISAEHSCTRGKSLGHPQQQQGSRGNQQLLSDLKEETSLWKYLFANSLHNYRHSRGVSYLFYFRIIFSSGVLMILLIFSFANKSIPCKKSLAVLFLVSNMPTHGGYTLKNICPFPTCTCAVMEEKQRVFEMSFFLRKNFVFIFSILEKLLKWQLETVVSENHFNEVYNSHCKYL